MPHLDSVNIGKPEPLAGKPGPKGIFKRPQQGPVLIERLGLSGDAVMDPKHHGGVDQAVYLYFADDYAWWSTERGTPMTPGLFGENLTISGVEGRSVGIGDRFTIGTAELEVTAHRMPCATLAKRMDDPHFVKAFVKAGRPGAYCRVIATGPVAEGDAVTHTRFAGQTTSVVEMMILDKDRDSAPESLRRALAAPIHHKLRHDFEQRLATLF